MKRFRNTLAFAITIFAVVGVVLATDLFRSISTNIRLYNNVVKQILAEYVDDIDSEQLITASIEGMLKDLDPYTVFIKEEDQPSVTMLTKGKYGGVGIRLGTRNGVLTVISPMEGTPAQRAGVRPGDQIIKVDSLKTADLTSDKAAKLIRGKPGTSVVLTFKRFGQADLLPITLVREEITINDLPYYGVVDGIGYIRLTRFSRNTAAQFSEAMKVMQAEGMEGLVVDLRGNPGGLLRDAVVMVDALVEPGRQIVETRGRSKKSMRKHVSKIEPVLAAEIPLVLLVDEGSASASEIVAGAVQDLDRGVIIGRPTFGKGLVQSIYPLGHNTSIKMTTAKYYIPSGRLIQKEDYLHNGVLTDGAAMHDSLFTTLNGRAVKGGGGIIPDIEVEREPLPALTRSLWSNSVFFSFATLLQDSISKELPFVVTDDLVQRFGSYIDTMEFDVRFKGESKLEEFQELLGEIDGFDGQVDFSDLEQYYEQRHSIAFADEQESIRRGLRLEFSYLLGGSHERAKSAITDDPVYEKAVEILRSGSDYYGIIQPDEEFSSKK